MNDPATDHAALQRRPGRLEVRPGEALPPRPAPPRQRSALALRAGGERPPFSRRPLSPRRFVAMVPAKVSRLLVVAAIPLLVVAFLIALFRCGGAHQRLARSDPAAAPCTVLHGHAGWVQALAFSPDGALLASGAGLPRRPGECKLWAVANGEERATLPGPTGGVCTLAFAPDGRTLALGGAESAVTFWDVATGTRRAALPMEPGWVRAVAYAPDGQTLAVLAGERVTLWDLTRNEQRDAFPAYHP